MFVAFHFFFNQRLLLLNKNDEQKNLLRQSCHPHDALPGPRYQAEPHY